MLQPSDTILGSAPPRSAYLEGFRVLRANLMAMHGREPFKSILITSASAREGKTTVAINLATVLALAGKKTILLDADANAQGLGREMGVRGTPGITDLCLGSVSAQDILHRTELDNLWLVSSGTRGEDASELAFSPSMREGIEQLAAQAEFLILDGTPCLGFGITLSLAPLVDLVLIVARARGKAEFVQQALATLVDAGTRVGGVIVNDILPQDSPLTEAYYQYEHGPE